MEKQEFLDWRKSLRKHNLFFDGAAKANPGAIGGGGILLDPDGVTILSYSWGLGVDTNNIT